MAYFFHFVKASHFRQSRTSKDGLIREQKNMCLYPKLIKNKKYTPTKKNGGIVPEIDDERKLYVPIGCGNCIECRNQKKREWQVRLHEEIKNRGNGKFVTLTFTNEELIKLENEIKKWNRAKRAKKTKEKKELFITANEIATLAVRRFLERWRKKYSKSVKHWLITELGHVGTERVHLHGIIFTEEDDDTIKEIWKYGGIWVGEYVNAKTINYIVKYITKIDEDHPGFKGKIFPSPGIGEGYIQKWDARQNKYSKNATNESYKLPTGEKTALPIYYRNKIYSEEEREKLWIEKLDKNIRWVAGQKIDVSTPEGEELYEKTLKYNQEKYSGMGFGNGKWKKKEYMAAKKELKNLKKEKK